MVGTMKTIVLVPAYGRKYNREGVIEDWINGKDFRSPSGYCSIRDIEYLKKDGFTHVGLYYQTVMNGVVESCIGEIEL